MNLIESCRAWLKTCPYIDSAEPFNANYLGADPTQFAVQAAPGETIVGEDVLGNRKKQCIFYFDMREAYGKSVAGNLEAAGVMQNIQDWVEQQNRARSFPALPAKCHGESIKITASSYITRSDEGSAVYRIQMKFFYIEEV